MQPQLQQVEVQSLLGCDDDLSIENASLWQLRLERLDQLGEVSIERLLVPALNEHLVAVAEDERAKPIPLGLEDPAVARRQLADALRQHRQDRRIDGEVH